jgi:hypothetical protein
MTLRYKVEGYAETRDSISWILLSAPNFKFGLTFDEVFAGLEHGYQSVREQLKDAERVEQWTASHQKLQVARVLLNKGDLHEGKLALQEASELFTMLRRIRGKAVSRKKIAATEHGANELDD